MGRKHRRVLSLNRALSIGAGALFAMALLATGASAQNSEEELPRLSEALEPLSPGVTENQVFAELASHNEQRRTALHDYSVLRTYEVLDLKGKVHAKKIGRMEFLFPDKKTFTVTSESGSGVVRSIALNSLIKSEIETATGKEHHDSAISPDNYSLNLVGNQQVGPYRCFVAEVQPKRKDKYLFEGKIWIDVEDYSVVRIEGRPAKQLSFWIQRADFVRQYQKIDRFWFPQKDRTVVQVRLYGNKVLTIDHRDYVVNADRGKNARAITSEATIASASSH